MPHVFFFLRSITVQREYRIFNTTKAFASPQTPSLDIFYFIFFRLLHPLLYSSLRERKRARERDKGRRERGATGIIQYWGVCRACRSVFCKKPLIPASNCMIFFSVEFIYICFKEEEKKCGIKIKKDNNNNNTCWAIRQVEKKGKKKLQSKIWG